MEGFQKYFVHQKGQSLPLFCEMASILNSKCLVQRKGTRKEDLYYAFLWFFFKSPFDFFELKKSKIIHYLLQNQKTYSYKQAVQKIVYLYMTFACFMLISFTNPFFLSIMEALLNISWGLYVIKVQQSRTCLLLILHVLLQL